MAKQRPQPAAQKAPQISAETGRLPSLEFQADRRFFLLLVAAVLIGIAVHYVDMRHIGLALRDDREADLRACELESGGVQEYVARTRELSENQGRIGMNVSYAISMLAYLVDAPWRALIITGVHILAFVCIAVFVGLYAGPFAATLVFIFLLCLLPHPGGHYPGDAYPVGFHIPIAAFFLATTAHALISRKAHAAWPARALIGLIILLALCVYEALDLIFAIVAAALWANRLGRHLRLQVRHPILATLRAEADVTLPFVVYAVCYGVYRLAHPPAYQGTQLAPPNLLATAASAGVYAVAGLPGANWFLGYNAIGTPAGLHGENWISFLFRHVDWPCVLLAFSFAAAVVAVVRIPEPGGRAARGAPMASDTRLPTCLRIAVVAVLAGYLSQVPLALSAKYRDNPANWAPYVPSGFAFLCFCVAAACLLTAILPKLHRGGTRPLIALAGICAAVVVITREPSSLMIRRHQAQYATWRVIDAFLKTDSFKALPDHALLLAPALWDTLGQPVDLFSDYWSRYFVCHGKKQVTVIRTPKEADGIPRNDRRAYYLEVQQPGDQDAAVVLFSDLVFSPRNSLTSRSVTVFSAESREQSALTFTPYAASQSTMPAAQVARVPALRRAAGGFVSSVQVPDGFYAGTAYLLPGAALSRNKLEAFETRLYDPNTVTSIPQVSIEFSDGFSGLETSPIHRWHWSDGASGEGTIVLRNASAGPLPVVFQACMTTGFPEPSRLTVQFRDEPAENASASHDCIPIRRRWVLEPGPNPVHLKSWAPRLPSGADTRYLVFGVVDWHVLPDKP